MLIFTFIPTLLIFFAGVDSLALLISIWGGEDQTRYC